MGKYISKQQLLNMLENVPNGAMLSVTDINDRNADYPIVAVEDSTMAGFYEIKIDSTEKW